MRSLSFSLLFSMERAGAHTRKGGRGVGEKRGGEGGADGAGGCLWRAVSVGTKDRDEGHTEQHEEDP